MLIKRLADQELTQEYGLSGVRTFPWVNVDAPFGSAYCIVSPHTASLDHVNQPSDEDELFIAIEGNAVVIVGNEEFEIGKGDQVFIPQGQRHFVKNDTDNPFHFYTIWWNGDGVQRHFTARSCSSSKE